MTKVTIQGLKANKVLNGMQGKLLRKDEESGRIEVMIAGKRLSLLDKNVRVQQPHLLQRSDGNLFSNGNSESNATTDGTEQKEKRNGLFGENSRMAALIQSLDKTGAVLPSNGRIAGMADIFNLGSVDAKNSEEIEEKKRGLAAMMNGVSVESILKEIETMRASDSNSAQSNGNLVQLMAVADLLKEQEEK